MKIKDYFKALNKYEKETNSFELLQDYLLHRNSHLAKFYCEGEIHLPSFMLIKQLHNTFVVYTQIDKELDKLFLKAINASKIFYSRLIWMIYESKSEAINFDQKFEECVQPVGQQIINLLVNIKYRIKVIKIQKLREEKLGVNKLQIGFIPALKNFIPTYWGKLIYELTLLKSTNHKLIKNLYYGFITFAIGTFWLINFLFWNEFSPISSTFINIIAGVIIVIFSIITYPIGDFRKIDITGRNIVAYKYKTFFNSSLNNIRLSVFSIQHKSSTGHSKTSNIKS